MRADKGQRHNLAARHPERVEAMQAVLKKIRERGYSAADILDTNPAKV